MYPKVHQVLNFRDHYWLQWIWAELHITGGKSKSEIQSGDDLPLSKWIPIWWTSLPHLTFPKIVIRVTPPWQKMDRKESTNAYSLIKVGWNQNTILLPPGKPNTTIQSVGLAPVRPWLWFTQKTWFEVFFALRGVKSDCAKLPTHGTAGLSRSTPSFPLRPLAVKVRMNVNPSQKPSWILCTLEAKIGLSSFWRAHKTSAGPRILCTSFLPMILQRTSASCCTWILPRNEAK